MKIIKSISIDYKYICDIEKAISNGLADNVSNFMEKAIENYLKKLNK